MSEKEISEFSLKFGIVYEEIEPVKGHVVTNRFRRDML